MKRKNRYRVHMQTVDQRVWAVTVKADYMTDDGFMIRFWVKHGPFGLIRTVVHYLHADVLVSINQED